MSKELFRATMSVEFDAEKVANKYALATAIAEVMKQGEVAFTKLAEEQDVVISVEVGSGFVTPRPKKPAAAPEPGPIETATAGTAHPSQPGAQPPPPASPPQGTPPAANMFKPPAGTQARTA